MQEEISKMSDEEILDFILLLNTSMTEYKMLKYYQNSDLIHTQLKEAKELFLKRLSKNNIEEFKKKLIKEIAKIKPIGFIQIFDEVKTLINKITQEKNND